MKPRNIPLAALFVISSLAGPRQDQPERVQPPDFTSIIDTIRNSLVAIPSITNPAAMKLVEGESNERKEPDTNSPLLATLPASTGIVRRNKGVFKNNRQKNTLGNGCPPNAKRDNFPKGAQNPRNSGGKRP